ncbi:MAG: hypothetical protein ACOCV1_03590 [Bacillota bacterium]
MKKYFCLGLCGQKRSGKDTIYNFIHKNLENEMNLDFKKVAFADAVKNVLCLFSYKQNGNLIKVDKEFIEEYKTKEDLIPESWNMSVREALNNIGDRFREVCPNVWIDIALNSSGNKIVTDVRYSNEISEIKKRYHSLIIKIIRPSFSKEKGHRSETSFIEIDKSIPNNLEGPCSEYNNVPYDYIIRNNGDLKDLEEKVKYKLLPFVLNRWKFFT